MWSFILYIIPVDYLNVLQFFVHHTYMYHIHIHSTYIHTTYIHTSYVCTCIVHHTCGGVNLLTKPNIYYKVQYMVVVHCVYTHIRYIYVYMCCVCMCIPCMSSSACRKWSNTVVYFSIFYNLKINRNKTSFLKRLTFSVQDERHIEDIILYSVLLGN